MFVQATKSRGGTKTYVSYLVREAFRTPAGPRSRTVCNITALPPAAREALAAALAGTPCVPLEGLTLSSALNYGGLAVLRDAWERFGLDHVLAPLPDPRSRSLVQAMIFGRVLSPCSKRALADEAQGTLLAAACGLDQATEAFDEDDLYAAMDALNGRWVPLEQALYGEAFGTAVSLVLYDLTSVYFEGKGPAGFSAYGYSRDHRPDRPQVLLAVATDADGGLAKAEAELTRLAAVPRKKVDPQKLASQAGRALQRLQAHPYFDYRADAQGRLCGQPKQALIDAEQSRDGLYLLHTGLTPAQGSTGEVWKHYKNLMAVEEAFCHLKTSLEVRPVYHFRPDRVRNHVRLCFLAHWLCARLGQEWRAKGQTGDAPRLLRRLQAIRVGTFTVAGQEVRRLLTQIPAELNAVLESLGLLSLFAQPPRWAQR